MNSKSKKQLQLGMNPATASNRLHKDILYSLVVINGLNSCHQCGEPMTRENFSIEHKEPWLDTENPKENYFDLNNIAFSHLSCNCKASRGSMKPENKEWHDNGGVGRRPSQPKQKYNPETRRKHYLKTGN